MIVLLDKVKQAWALEIEKEADFAIFSLREGILLSDTQHLDSLL